MNGEVAEQPSCCSDQGRSAAVGVKRCWKMLQECIFENLEHELELAERHTWTCPQKDRRVA